MANLKLINISKKYDNTYLAVNNFNVDIKSKEFIVLLGPSGCGKSTILRMIAGLEEISQGEIYIDDVLVNSLEPKDRDVAMVFQNYALYPHLNVYDNIAFSLKLRKENKQTIDTNVKEAAEKLGLSHLLNRKPSQLSGGQRQRVALGRAIVREPKVFLLDEPLSNLDAKLRVKMRAEISKLHNNLKVTTIYVTHDQVEAMTMGDRIIVMDKGQIMQIGTPEEIYNKPENIFVAKFIGNQPINLTKIKLKKEHLNFYEELIPLPNNIYEKYHEVIMGIRPENIVITSGNDFKITLVENLGSEKLIYIENEKDEFVIKSSSNKNYKINDCISIKIRNCDKLNFFDSISETLI